LCAAGKSDTSLVLFGVLLLLMPLFAFLGFTCHNRPMAADCGGCCFEVRPFLLIPQQCTTVVLLQQ
jgi:hypothetical protein